MAIRIAFTFICGFISLFSASAVHAQESFSSGIIATGTESIQLKPTKLQLVMQAKAQASDARTAIKSLADHRERIKKELLAMKADESSISFSATSLASGGKDDQRQAYMQMQMKRQNPGSTDAVTMPKILTATCTVKAEWPLPIQEGDALALLPATLMEQIEARDLVGNNNKPKLDEAAAEKMEEMQAMMQEQYSYYNSDEESTGPKILFMANISSDQVVAATKAAFEQATKKATELAAASGQKLGKLTSLTTNGTSPSEYESFYMAQYASRSGYGTMPAQSENTVVAQKPDQLTKSVTIAVVYAISD